MKFYCDQCHTKYQIADEKVVGKTVRMKCRKCEAPILIRGAELSAAPESVQYDGQSGDPVGWHVAVNGAPAGPFQVDALRAMASSGHLDIQALAWRDGMADWKPIPEIPELYSLLTRASQKPGPPPNPFERTMGSVPPPAKPLGAPPPSGNTQALLAQQAEIARQQAQAQQAREQAERARLELEAQQAELTRQRAQAELAQQQAHAKFAREQAEFAKRQAEAQLAQQQAAAQLAAQQLEFERQRSLAPAADAFAPVRSPSAVDHSGDFSDRHPLAATALANFAPAGVAASHDLPAGAMVSSSAVLNPPSSAFTNSMQLPVKSSGKNAIIGILVVVLLGLGGTVFYLATRKTEPEVVTKVVEVTKTVTVEVPTAAAPTPVAAGGGGSKRPSSGGQTAAAPPKSGGSKVDLSDLGGSPSSGKAGGLGDLAGPSAGPSDRPGAGGSGISSADVQSVVSSRSPAMKRHCIDKSSGGVGTSKVVAHLVVGPSGNVQSVRTDGNDPDMGRCVEAQIRAWQFPAPGSPTNVDIPFTFVRQ